jgi:hypothetical protein
MMLLYFFLYVILFIAGMYLLFKVIKSVLKILLIGILVLMVTIGLFSFFLFSDAKNFSTNFVKEPKLIVLVDNDRIIFAEEILGLNKSNLSAQFKVLGAAATETLNDFYKEGEMEELKGSYFKVFIVKLNVLEESLPKTIELPKELSQQVDNASRQVPSWMEKPKLPDNLSKAELLSMIKSDNPQKIVIDMMLKDMPLISAELLRPELRKTPELSDENVKAIAVALAGKTVVEKSGFKVLFNYFQKGDIQIYPETFIFKLAKGIPYGLFKKYIPVNVTNSTK